MIVHLWQPPPRGCVLKPLVERLADMTQAQPPPRGCVLKPQKMSGTGTIHEQPPPRGCVLKLPPSPLIIYCLPAAASARLCVETSHLGLLQIFT